MDRKEHPSLSERERQLIDLAAQGLIDTAIANKLGISEATVSTYWGRVRVKIGPYSRTEIVAIVMKEESEKAMAALKEENEKLSERLRIDAGDYHNESNFYRDLLEVAADAMFIVNSNGIIENLNDSAAALFGYERNDLLGQPIKTLIPERYRMIHDSHREAYLSQPGKKKMGEHLATMALHRSGKEFSVAATLSSLPTESDVAILCIVRAVSLL
ncbi:MAG: PAS domain S-box protein [Armatimonadetes bacterium]|nr:PAS domain S-box protein [Armatimonadota bacterium]